MTDSDFMKLALSLAENGRGFTSPNPMVGAVVVKDGRIIGRGWHQKAGGPHAEVHAIDDAGPEARGADLYVTLEPCNHHGRTPPCTKKILAAGIRRVVVAMDDPNPDVAGGGAEFLKQQGITVISGVCENDARRLNEFFITHVRKRRPFVILKTAATLDGRIATRTGDSRWVTGERARAHVHEIRHAVDAIMVGVNTILTDDPSLTTRREGGKPGVNPRRFILDTRLSVPDNAKVLRIPPASDTVIVTGDSGASEKRQKLADTGVEIMEAACTGSRIDLAALMPRLSERGVTSLLIEGGARVAASALAAGIVDKVCFFYAPKILGGDDGVPMCRGPGPERMDQCLRLRDMALRRFDEDIMVEGYLDRPGEK
ncbi:MAG: bifunctional diaminohydroxyphosphoribosylaminopyrimidine deaminase/5-amino-6-(5-phosphoribosylamino)uracil reductase RibD [Desulfobacteraceae bacterium]|jgi:diaminohydroxyphosphoribosylaminopyrimidine deaminase/5-amino-6-(5-phosphoribosylamino)uracil reductase|nr:MAG: bifunctional diaminohydroxyphosphoribosylaminopyrimidine deaminase/5-amino-6-(5-phosphoribosylamino)uracil reductase RibD [Desulfobacteraceae bacterium]